MDTAFRRAYVKRGSVFLFHKFDFQDGISEPQPKFCVLMEDYIDEFDYITVFLTTTNLSHPKMTCHIDIPSIKYEFWEKNIRVDCDNYFLIEHAKLFSRKCKPVGFLLEDDIEEILDKSINAENIPDNIRVRLYDY